MSWLRHWHQHRPEPVGQRRGGNAEESASGDHNQILPVRFVPNRGGGTPVIGKGNHCERKTESRRERRTDRHTRLNPRPSAVSPAKPRTQHRRNSDYGCTFRPPLAAGVSLTSNRVWVSFVTGGSCGGLSCPLIHDPARLRSRLVLPPSIGERLGRPRYRRADADTL